MQKYPFSLGKEWLSIGKWPLPEMWDRGTTDFHQIAVQNFVAKHEIGILFVALSERAVLVTYAVYIQSQTTKTLEH